MVYNNKVSIDKGGVVVVLAKPVVSRSLTQRKILFFLIRGPNFIAFSFDKRKESEFSIEYKYHAKCLGDN